MPAGTVAGTVAGAVAGAVAWAVAAVAGAVAWSGTGYLGILAGPPDAVRRTYGRRKNNGLLLLAAVHSPFHPSTAYAHHWKWNSGIPENGTRVCWCQAQCRSLDGRRPTPWAM